MAKKKICFVVNIEYVINNFLINHIYSLSKIYDITIVVNADVLPLISQKKIKARIYKIEFCRGVNFLIDLKAMFKLQIFFLNNKFDAVHSVTPKIGFFSMVTSFIAGVKLRIHIFTGQVWCNDEGFKKFFFKFLDKTIVFFSTHLLVDSKSQLSFLVQNKICKKNHLLILGEGSISGVDIKRFKPNISIRNKIRNSLSIPSNAFCLIFVGRLCRSKGIIDLVHALNYLNNPRIFLIFVGNDEDNITEYISLNFKLLLGNIRYIGYSHNQEDYMAASDLLCLPSYREGFGSVIIEAAACGLPSIGSDIYGIRDAIEPNKSGLLHKAGNIKDIAQSINYFFHNPLILKDMGLNAKRRVKIFFKSQDITKQWLIFYENIFK